MKKLKFAVTWCEAISVAGGFGEFRLFQNEALTGIPAKEFEPSSFGEVENKFLDATGRCGIRRIMKRLLLLGHLEVVLVRESRTGRHQPLALQVASWPSPT